MYILCVYPAFPEGGNATVSCLIFSLPFFANESMSHARKTKSLYQQAMCSCSIRGKPIGGGREGVQAGRRTNILQQNDHQTSTKSF